MHKKIVKILFISFYAGRMDEKEFLQWIARIQTLKHDSNTPSTSKTIPSQKDIDDDIAQDLIAAFR